MEITERLKAVMAYLSMKQVDFAESIGCTQATLSRQLNGTHKINKQTALAIQAVHKINSNWLLTGEGSMLDENLSSYKQSSDLEQSQSKFWIRLRRFQAEENISDDTLSAVLDIKKEHLSKLLKGSIAKPSADLVVRLMKHYHISPLWLVWGEGDILIKEVECLERISSENIHQTRWFKELDRDRQFLVAAANTPRIPDKDIARVVGYLQASQDKADEAAAAVRYKKGAAG